jgi:hypothetical protein
MLSAADVGQLVSVTVTASNSAGQALVTSGTVGPVLPAAPVDTTAPGITGTAQQGATLGTSNGLWTNSPTAYSYAWGDCNSSGSSCSAIAGATSSTYTLTAADVSKYMSVTVTASNSGGHGSVTSASVGPVLPPPPVNTAAPTVSGTDEQGDTLSVSSGTWDNSPTGFAYAWMVCNSSGNSCSPIAGATFPAYTQVRNLVVDRWSWTACPPAQPCS